MYACMFVHMYVYMYVMATTMRLNNKTGLFWKLITIFTGLFFQRDQTFDYFGFMDMPLGVRGVATSAKLDQKAGLFWRMITVFTGLFSKRDVILNRAYHCGHFIYEYRLHQFWSRLMLIHEPHTRTHKYTLPCTNTHIHTHAHAHAHTHTHSH